MSSSFTTSSNVKLVASLIVHNERARYLERCIEHLLEFCDRVVILDDASDDGTVEWFLQSGPGGVVFNESATSNFYVHEGRTRQRLIDLTLAQEPTHVLSVDDQFYPGESLRTNVHLGKAKLLCTPATVTVTSNTTVGTGFALADHLMCYEAPPAGTSPKVLKQVADPFATQTVEVGVARYTCVGAFKCDVGGSCPAQ